MGGTASGRDVVGETASVRDVGGEAVSARDVRGRTFVASVVLTRRERGGGEGREWWGLGHLQGRLLGTPKLIGGWSEWESQMG